MKKSLYIFCAIVFLFAAGAKAQNETTVTIHLEKTGNAAATIVIKKLPDSMVVLNKLITDSLTVLLTANTNYLIKVTASSALPATQFVPLKEEPMTIYLSLIANVTNLDQVVVVSKKPLITREDDKEIIDAEVLSNSSTNAFEVLEKTPGAIIDQDGNVYLSSTTPATVYINGREMKLNSADIASLLKSLPANSIQKIEILRTPSAKYDASGSGGIVNIVLKKGVKIGFNGSANVSSFQGKKNTSSVGITVNKSSGKWNSFGSYQYTNSNNFERLNSDRLIALDSSSVLQNSYTEFPGANHYLGGGTDYQLHKKLNISYDAGMSLNNSNSNAENNNVVIKKATGTILNNNQSLIDNKNRSFYFSNALSGKYKIDSLGSEWTNEVTYNIFNADNSQRYNNIPLGNSSNSTFGDGTQQNNKYIFGLRSDFTYKFKNKITLEAGLKYSNSNSSNQADYFIQRPGDQRKVDSFQTNQFRYTEQISATYLQLARTIFGFTLKPGLRLETTDIIGKQQVPADTSFSIKRTDLFPYVYLSHNLFKIFKNDLVANAIYRRSITRPYYENLNPYLKYVDQYLFETGNPNLKPQFTTNYEFNVSYDNFPVFSIGVNDTKDIFSNVTYQDQVTKIAFRTYDNLGKNKEFYFRAVGGIPPGGKYFFYAGGRYNRNTYDGFYQNKPLNYSYDGWVFFMYQEYKFSRSLNVNMQGFMRTKGLQNFYEIGSFGGLYFSLNKNVLKNKGTVSLSLRDALYTNPVDFSLDQNGIQATGRRENDSRRVGLKFRYNFGLQKKKDKGGFIAPNVEGSNQ